MASKLLQRFVCEAFKKAVDSFIDDPIDYCDGEPIEDVLKELTEIGKEISIDINKLIMPVDMEEIQEAIRHEKVMWVNEDDEYFSSDRTHSQLNGHMNMTSPFKRDTIDFFDEDIPVGKKIITTSSLSSIEDKLKNISKERKREVEDDEREPVGEWSTYDFEEDDDVNI